MTEKKSFLESIDERKKPESFAEEKFEHVKGGSPRKWILFGVIAGIVIASILALTSLTGRVNVPDLAGMSMQDAYVWAQKNNISLAVKDAYSFEVEENVILDQDVASGGSIKKGSIITVTASLGPDPEELVEFPDLKAMTLYEIEAWVSENKLTGIRIETSYSDIVEENLVIDYSLTDGTEEAFMRKNRVTITVSRGSVALSETVVVEDFSNMKAAAILQWGAEQGVTIKLSEAFDQYVAAGNVISQSIRKEVEIKRDEEITVIISKGKPVTVANLTAMSKDEASSWAKLNNVTLTFIESYTDSYDRGKIYKQSTASGRTISEGDEIKVYYSLGRVQVPSYIGKTKLDILNWQQDVNAKGGGISLTFSEAYGDRGSAGTIIGQSIINDMVAADTKIAVVISKGMQLVTPDFTGMTEEEAKGLSKEMGLMTLYEYENSEDVERGYVIRQSIKKDTLMSDAETIIITISLGSS